MSAIRHTSEEKHALAERVIALLRSDVGLGRGAAIFKAQQEMFKPNRRRPLDTLEKILTPFPYPDDLAERYGIKRSARPTLDSTSVPPPPDPSLPANERRRLWAIRNSVIRKQSGTQSRLPRDGRQRIVWSSDEKDELVVATARALFDGRAKKLREAMELAQDEVFASRPARRRVIRSMTRLSFLHAGVAQMMTKLRSDAAAAAKSVTQTVVQAVAAVENSPNGAHAGNGADTHWNPQRAVAGPSALSPLQGLLVSVLGTLRETIVDELTSMLVDAVRQAGLARRGPAELAEPPVPSADEMRPAKAEAPERYRPIVLRPPRPPKQTVLIVGLKGAQKGVIEAEYGAELALRYHGSDESKVDLRAKAAAADVTVCFTDFISHSHQDIAAKHSPHYIKSSGGISSLRATLNTLIVAKTQPH